MEEKHLTVDGITHVLPERFCLFATQNPRGQYGTYPLPESQLDRFLFKISMGHLTKKEVFDLLMSGSRLEKRDKMNAMISGSDLKIWEEEMKGVTVSKMLLEYLSDERRGLV